MSNLNKDPLLALDVPPRTKHSIYPEPYATRMKKRVKRQLGDYFGLKKFGVNLTELLPGGESALQHQHTKQEEFIYILKGHPTLVLDEAKLQMGPGMCIGFEPLGRSHKLINETDDTVLYLEVGDRERGDEANYPADDLVAKMDEKGAWKFFHKDGRAY